VENLLLLVRELKNSVRELRSSLVIELRDFIKIYSIDDSIVLKNRRSVQDSK
jgi:hypothetical protein